MKKVFFLSVLAAVAALTFTSCNKETHETYHPRKFAVKNATDKTITVTGDPDTGWFVYTPVTISPGQSRLVAEDYLSGGMYGEGNYGYGNYGSDDDDGYDLSDFYMKDNMKPDFHIPYGGDDSGLDMSIGETKVPAAIWTRKYWDFLPDWDQMIYTLTVTDELLASLTPAQPVDPAPAPGQ